MKIILSPAKSLNFDKMEKGIASSEPIFKEEALYLASKLKKKSKKNIQSLMKLSDDLASLNYERFQSFGEQDKKQALFAFTGEVYRGLDSDTLNSDELKYIQNNVRVLSGLYGILKPLDLIEPYRLEMGTKFSAKPSLKNLYDYWGNKVQSTLQKELDADDGILINLASNEYAKVAHLKKLKGKIITPVFKENKNGNYKVIMMYAKKARGVMTRYLAKNNADSLDWVKTFDEEGYVFSEEMSTESEWVFIR